MAVVKDNSVEFAVISGKFASNKVCKHNDVELEYGVNAFKTLAEAMEAIATDKVIFADAKTTLTQQEIELLGDTEAVYGNFSDDWEEVPVPAKNTLNIKDAESDKYFNNFLTVNAENSQLGFSVFQKDNAATVKTGYSKVYKNENGSFRDKIKTYTYKHDGKITLKNTNGNAMYNYLNVTLQNSSAGLIERSSLTKREFVVDTEWKNGSGTWESENLGDPTDSKDTYAANGSVTITLDKNAEGEYTVGDIYGYKTVKISGFTDKKNPENNVVFCASNINLNSGDSQLSDVGSVTLTQASAGSIASYLTVNITDSTVADIAKGEDTYNRKESKKSKKYKHSYCIEGCKGSDLYETITVTDTYKKNGSLTLKNSSAGSISNYNTVTMTNSTAGNITNSTLSKVISTTERYIPLTDCEGNVFEDDGMDSGYTFTEKTYAASGAVTVKADKSCTADSLTVGNISGYKTVTLTGYADKKTGNVIAVTAGTITGGNEIVEEYATSKSVSGSVKLANAQTKAISGFNTVTLENTVVNGNVTAVYSENQGYFGSQTDKNSGYSEMSSSYNRTFTVKSADKFSIKNGSVKGDVQGYKTVTVDSADITGNISMGSAYVTTYKSSYSYKNDSDTGNITGSTTATKNGSITIKNSSVGKGFDIPDYGNIDNYNRVTITNSVVGNIIQDDFFKFTGKIYRKYSSSENIEERTGSLEYKASGSATVKLDKNAAEGDFYTGSIEGYEKVTITGYSSKTAVNKIVVNGPIVGGASTADDVFFEDYGESLEYDRYAEGARTVKATGSATISYAEVWGDIRGYNTVTLTDASAYSIDSKGYKGEAVNEVVGKSVTLIASSVESVSGYSTININKGVSYVGELHGTNGNDKLTIAKGAVLEGRGINLFAGKDTLNISGTLLFSEGGSLSNLESITGNGEIAACGYSYEDVKSLVADTAFKGSVLDLGNTAYNFCGTAYEKSDDTFKKAVSFTGNSYSGWLGSWSKDGEVAGTDELDYVKVTLEEGQSFEVMGANCTILDSKGNTVGSTDLAYGDYAAGDYVFKLSIDENYGSSSSYNISIYSHLA